MAGLEKIVEQILQEAKAEADAVVNKAKTEAEQVIAKANDDAAKIKAQADEKINIEKSSGASRAKSSSDLKKRQAILKAKQAIINDMIDKAYDKMTTFSDDRYFEIIEKCLVKSVQPKAGEICFSKKDIARLPKDMSDRIDKIAEARGGTLTISKEHKNIDGGFILVYGGIEENCSFKAMFNAEREKLADKVNTFLFVEK